MTFTRRGLGALLVGAIFGRRGLPKKIPYNRRCLVMLQKKFTFSQATALFPSVTGRKIEWYRYSNLREPAKDA